MRTMPLLASSVVQQKWVFKARLSVLRTQYPHYFGRSGERELISLELVWSELMVRSYLVAHHPVKVKPKRGLVHIES